MIEHTKTSLLSNVSPFLAGMGFVIKTPSLNLSFPFFYKGYYKKVLEVFLTNRNLVFFDSTFWSFSTL